MSGPREFWFAPKERTLFFERERLRRMANHSGPRYSRPPPCERLRLGSRKLRQCIPSGWPDSSLGDVGSWSFPRQGNPPPSCLDTLARFFLVCEATVDPLLVLPLVIRRMLYIFPVVDESYIRRHLTRFFRPPSPSDLRGSFAAFLRALRVPYPPFPTPHPQPPTQTPSVICKHRRSFPCAPLSGVLPPPMFSLPASWAFTLRSARFLWSFLLGFSSPQSFFCRSAVFYPANVFSLLPVTESAPAGRLHLGYWKCLPNCSRRCWFTVAACSPFFTPLRSSLLKVLCAAQPKRLNCYHDETSIASKEPFFFFFFFFFFLIFLFLVVFSQRIRIVLTDRLKAWCPPFGTRLASLRFLSTNISCRFL